MKAICFRCRFVGVGIAAARCPHCGYPLIADAAPVALSAEDLERAMSRDRGEVPLPGVTPGPSVAQVRLANRRARAEQQRRARAAAARRARRRVAGDAFAASALLAAMAVLVLQAVGAL